MLTLCAGSSKAFCSKACQNVYVMTNRKIVPCANCKVRIRTCVSDQDPHYERPSGSVSDPGPFVWIRIGIFPSPDQDRQKNPDRIRNIRIRIHKKTPKSEGLSKKICLITQHFRILFWSGFSKN